MASNIPSQLPHPSFFSATVHVTYHRDLEAHYLALLNITAQYRGRYPQRSMSTLGNAPSLVIPAFLHPQTNPRNTPLHEL